MKHVVVIPAMLVAIWLPAAPVEGAKVASASESAPFTAVQKIETDLQRGVSLKADVKKILGEANGSGECFLPGQNEPREVWFYEDVELTSYRKTGDAILAEMRQQLLLVFFEGDRFDGFLWTSNTLNADGSLRVPSALSSITE